ncbi:MAG: nucleotide exchange factor GrpE [Planctomycetes bacterium]|nr:nucleotide exchange factor GrpE [Planctomycetota bacterium]
MDKKEEEKLVKRTNGEPAGEAGLPQGAESAPAPSLEEMNDLKAKLEEALSSAKRWQAEFVNYQSRVARDREADRKFATESLLRELLPAVDTVQHCVAQISKAGAAPAVLEAMLLVEKDLLRILGKHGVKPIEARGAPFDPGLHEALGAVESAGVPADSVIEVLRPGYMLHERVLRPAQVKVARTEDAEGTGGP